MSIFRLKAQAVCLVLLLGVNFTMDLNAEVSVGGGSGGSCQSVVDKITRRWSDVKQVMLPHKAKLNRAKRENFYCLSSQAIRMSIEKRITHGLALKCYSDPDGMGLGVCCDESLTACVRLRPDVVPEATQRRKKEPRYQKSNSDWVRPPSDKDQW